MYSIIQKIYEKNNKILKEGLKKVLSGEDVSSLTVAIKEFTDVLGKELFSEIAKQLDEIRSRVNDPAWWYGTRAKCALLLVVAEEIGAKYIVPTNIAQV